jgi:hypothetical protein
MAQLRLFPNLMKLIRGSGESREADTSSAGEQAPVGADPADASAQTTPSEPAAPPAGPESAS